MTSREMSYMLASSNLNLNKMVWCYQIKLGHRQVRLFILDEWGDQVPKNTVKPPAALTSTATEHPLLKAIGYDPAHLDTLVARTGWSAADLQAQLLELELEGWVHRLAGGLFQRTGQA